MRAVRSFSLIFLCDITRNIHFTFTSSFRKDFFFLKTINLKNLPPFHFQNLRKNFRWSFSFLTILMTFFFGVTFTTLECGKNILPHSSVVIIHSVIEFPHGIFPACELKFSHECAMKAEGRMRARVRVARTSARI